MKKLAVFTILLLGILMFANKTMAYDSDYGAFEEFEMESGQRLEDWSTETTNELYKLTLKRKAFGWRIIYINRNVKVKYKSNTLFSYYNDGSTPIKISNEKEEEESIKRVTSVKGACKLTGKSTNKKLANGLETSIEASYTSTSEYSSKESWKIDFEVDPQTKVVMYTEGTGKITNGVAAKYSLWFRCVYGAFEIFVITSQYQRFEKTRIR